MEFKVQKINTDQLKNRLKRDRPFVLVDVREMEAFVRGHIPGASSMHDGKVIPRVKSISKGTDIILYGPGLADNAKLLEDAAEKFMSLGSRYVYMYVDGFNTWSNANNLTGHSLHKMY